MNPGMEMKREGFAGKVFNKLEKPVDIFSWRIKFPEDVPLSVMPEDNFYITDRENTLVDFEVHVEHRTNSVLISPMEPYSNNVFYFLHIKKFDMGNILSDKKLPPIHVGFKVKTDNSLELIWLKGRFDPKTIMQQALDATQKKANAVKQEYLGRMDFSHNTILVYPILLASIVMSVLPPEVEGIALGIAAFILILSILQLIIYFLEKKGKKIQSVDEYNVGIANYTSGYFQNAETHFNKALTSNPRNQNAEKALEINRRYLLNELTLVQDGDIDLERKTFKQGKLLLFMAAGCAVANALVNIALVTDTNINIYFHIAMYCCILFQIVFYLIQRHSPEKQSVDEYNKGANAFESKDWNTALEHFNQAIKLDVFNRHAQTAKEIMILSMISSERKKKLEEEEELKKQIKDKMKQREIELKSQIEEQIKQSQAREEARKAKEK